MPFVHLADLKTSEPVPGFTMRVVHGDNVTVVHWDIAKDAVMPAHSHPHEQIANVIEGEFELTVNGETQICRPGNVAVIRGDVTHSGKALTDCKIIDVFYPLRMDYR